VAFSVPEQRRLRHPISYFRTELYATPANRSDTPWCIRRANLRNIRALTFDLPSQGVWLLTAGNGSGKTSLLACLRRIGYANAFPVHFPSSAESEILDDFSGASVTYSLNDEEVEYAYRGERWAPRPRKNSRLLADFGYPQVIYLGANADRITPRPEDFAPRRVRPAPPTLITAANQIFETNKFNELKVVNLTTGVGNQAFLMKVGENPTKYHSEKNFSLGELCILKLVEGIRDCPNQSLVLIDELEMALHPRAQVQLYRYLEVAAARKRLTVIFSTHSVSLLKTVQRSSIIYLYRDDDGCVDVVRGCFPTYAIGNITIGEEQAPDCVLYVEDEVAKAIVEPVVKLALQERFAANSLFPDVRVIPIGGFDAVVQFLTHHGVLMPEGTRAFAMLDNDVRVETVASWEANGKHQKLADFQRLGNRLDYLPWTPEVGMLEFLRDRRVLAERMIREELGRPMFSLDQATFDPANGLNGSALRNAAKRIIGQIAEGMGRSAGISRDESMKILCQLFAKEQFDARRNDLLDLILPKVA
jgi:energy-coupling factor transporter ATP-binding protein EcfA2